MYIFTSIIKSTPDNSWYIELSDMSKENHIEICNSIEEYADKIELMGQEYDEEIKVEWSNDDNITLSQIDEVRKEMMEYEAKLLEENNLNL